MVVIALLFIIPLFVQVNTCHEWLRKFDEIKIIILESFVEISFNRRRIQFAKGWPTRILNY